MPRDHDFPLGFFMVPNELFGDGCGPGWAAHVGASALAVYALILRRYHRENGTSLYETHTSMAKTLGMSEPTLRRSLKKLLNTGLIRAIPQRKRRYPGVSYLPVLPLPAVPEGKEPRGNTKNSYVTITKESFVTGPGLRNNCSPITKDSFTGPSEEPMTRQADTPENRPPNRLINRLSKDMSVDERVRRVKENPEAFHLRAQAQTAWEYWGKLWEAHYRRTYYRGQDPENRRTVPKDKRNLRLKIEAVGFVDVVDRMERCFEVCDELFPCVQNGKWLRPVMLNDFVNARFFDQWITPKKESAAREPMTVSEKIERALERRVRIEGDEAAEEAAGGDA